MAGVVKEDETISTECLPEERTPFVCFVNGKLICDTVIQPQCTLVKYLRERLGLTGTKVACGVGGCGSCTAIISKYDPISNEFSHIKVNTCITLLPSVAGCHVLTIEGLSEAGGKTCHAIQDAIARGNGTQCGFCTPGMVMSMYDHCHDEKNVSVKSIKNALQGNLCRCTGYRPILEAFNKCSKEMSESSGCGVEIDIEDLMGNYPHIEGARKIKQTSALPFSDIEILLKTFYEQKQCQVDNLLFQGIASWYRPSTLAQFRQFVQNNPTAKIISGGTSKYIQENLLDHWFVDITKIPETRVTRVTPDDKLVLGAALTIAEMVKECNKVISSTNAEKVRVLKTIIELMQHFGSQQIRNVATIGGSVKINWNASDVETVFTGCEVTANVMDKTTDSQLDVPLPIDENKIILSFQIPFTKPNEFTWARKVSRRKDCDASVINAAFKIRMATPLQEKKVERILLVFGGTAIKRFSIDLIYEEEPVELNEAFFEDMRQTINVRVVKNIDSNEFTIAYLCSAAKGLFQKFMDWLKLELNNSQPDNTEDKANVFKNTQLFSLVKDGQLRTDLVGRAVPHASAYKHATGEAKFCDDTPKYAKELEMAFVCSTEAYATITNIDATEALEMNGVIGFLSHEDLPKDKNNFGLVEKDEEIFASTKVLCIGQTIGAIVAVDRDIAKSATKLVKISYELRGPLILTNQDAIKHNSYYPNWGMKLVTGNCKETFENSTHVSCGEVTVGAAAHFYMEPQSCIAIPKGEDGEMEIIASTQNVNYIQHECARILGVPANHIVVKTKRVGGGFGGKESRCMLVALPAAIAAKKFNQPVRCILDRETDMMISGKRHTFLTQHKIGFDCQGRLSALQMKLYINAGMSLDVSMAAIERAVVNVDNAYNIPNVDLDGYVCKTNTPSNTVFRGTGGPQAAFLIENIMDHIATVVNKDPVEVRKLNMYKDGDVTPYGQTIANCTIHRCWDECLRLSLYQQRRDEINTYNKANQSTKRGIAVTPCNFGIGYTALHLNQGAALVHIYTDGSVLVSHGGVEIGQGVHSKMIQVATRELGIPASKIRILETASDKVPNATPSSASVTSDLSGGAVLNACQKLANRLEPYKVSSPNASWEEIVTKAYMDRVGLSSTGFYSVPNMGWDENRKGSPWNYFSTGAACSEVEIDCLTGEYQILRTDIVMDVGESLNPSIDIGQIEGAFIQGVGLFALEELITDTNGNLITTGPNNYKIPTMSDAPLEFNVSILSGSSNPRAIYSSKTVGEPPLLLATSVFFAIKDAIRAQRLATGIQPVNFHMDSPATVEKILLACKHI